MSAGTRDRRFSVKELAERYVCSQEKVLDWIATHQLRAVNIARKAKGIKPRWRVSEADLLAFEEARASTPAPQPQRRRRKTAGPKKAYV